MMFRMKFRALVKPAGTTIFMTALALAFSSCAMLGSGGGRKPASANDSKSGYRLRPFEEKTLENGLKILYVPDEALPYISLSLMVRSGAAQDPENQPGLASFVAEMLDKGTRKRSATQIADELGKLGADFDASASADYSLVSLSGLSHHGEQMLGNLAEIVMQPVFSDVEIERTRKNFLAQIERRLDHPDVFASNAFSQYLYGSHAYAHPAIGTEKSVRSLKKKNIIQHYLRFYRPNNTLLAVVGKITPEFKSKVETAFGAWEKREIPTVPFGKVPEIKGVQIELIDKPGLVQTQIRMGELGIKRQDPDFLALRIGNTILGGAFASRLNDRIRKDLGLTYSISSAFDARADVGPFGISTFTKNQSVGQVVSESVKVLAEFKSGGVTKEEVERAKGYLKGVFPSAIETAEKLAFNLMALRLYGIPDSYLTNYLSDIDSLSTSDINRAIRSHIDEKNIKVVVFSNAAEARPQLEKLGTIEVKQASEIE